MQNTPNPHPSLTKSQKNPQPPPHHFPTRPDNATHLHHRRRRPRTRHNVLQRRALWQAAAVGGCDVHCVREVHRRARPAASAAEGRTESRRRRRRGFGGCERALEGLQAARGVYGEGWGGGDFHAGLEPLLGGFFFSLVWWLGFKAGGGFNWFEGFGY